MEKITKKKLDYKWSIVGLSFLMVMVCIIVAMQFVISTGHKYRKNQEND